MALYQLKLRTTSGALTNAPCWGLLTTANHTVRLKDLRVVLGTALASEFSLGLAAAAGTQTGGTSGISLHDMTSTSTSKLAIAWSANPTIPATFIDGVSFANTVGSIMFFPFPEDGLYIPPSSELVLWNTGATTNGAISHITALFEEL